MSNETTFPLKRKPGMAVRLYARLWNTEKQKYVFGTMTRIHDDGTANMIGDDGVNYWGWKWSLFDVIRNLDPEAEAA